MEEIILPCSKEDEEKQDLPMQSKVEITDLPLHLRIGIDQELFFFNDSSPGSCFWLPNGTILYNRLQQLIKDEYFARGFDQVMTPVIAKKDLWEISGHWNQYKENMFCFDCDNTEYAICAMNCPKSCLLYKNKVRSHKELPMRLADFGNLHRNELSGALTGLTRVRAFHQDDAHIFCTFLQIKSEIKSALEFLEYIYNIFGFKFELNLSTRPEKAIGEIDTWNKAESMLTNALDEIGMKWQIDKGGGAFYGPKIDVHLTDSIGRKHQCGTIQLDFQLPGRFELKYVDENNEFQTPVIIHRAIYGSFERFVAILIEHYNGSYPLWLNPRQIVVIPVVDKFIDYAKKVKDGLRKFKFYVDVDDSTNTLKKKVRDAQVNKYNYILVVGKKEMDENTVHVRHRDNDNKEIMTIEELATQINSRVSNFE